MGRYGLASYASLIIIVSIIAFFIPSALHKMAFSGDLFLKEMELWRLISFPFVHIGTMHMIQNIIAISIMTYIGHEVDLSVGYYLGTFFAVSFAIAIITGFILPAMLIAGLSLGIYAIFGGISVKASRLVPKKYLIPILAIVVLIEPLISLTDSATLSSSVFHLLGFAGGIGYSYTIKRIIPKKRILTQEIRR